MRTSSATLIAREGLQRYAEASNYAALLFLFILKTIIFVNVFFRYVLENPIAGVVEISRIYLMVGLTVFAWPYIHKHDENIVVSSMAERFLSVDHQRIRDIGYNVALFAFLVIVQYSVVEQTLHLTIRRSTTVGIVRLPTYVSWWILLLGLTLFMIAVVEVLYVKTRAVRS